MKPIQAMEHFLMTAKENQYYRVCWPNAKCQSVGESSQAALTSAQLLKSNNVKHARKTEEGTRHFKSQEAPLPVYIGVMLHVKTRKNG